MTAAAAVAAVAAGRATEGHAPCDGPAFLTPTTTLGVGVGSSASSRMLERESPEGFRLRPLESTLPR
jgi:hypothetical protein